MENNILFQSCNLHLSNQADKPVLKTISKAVF